MYCNIGIVGSNKIGRIGNLKKSLEPYEISIVEVTAKNAYEIDVFVLLKPTDVLKSLPNKIVIIDPENHNCFNSVSGFNDLCVITCGLSYKSTVTASSVSDGECVFCLQRSIFTIDNKELQPQEFVIKTLSDTYSTLALCTAFLICGIKAEQIVNLTF